MLRCAITDRGYRAGDGARWSRDGVDFVQLRDKTLDAGELARIARAIVAEIRSAGGKTQLLVNGRADVAAAMDAAGVHLTARAGELTPEQVRRVFAQVGRRVPMVSVACHSDDEVVRARESRAALILFGPVFEKRVGGERVQEGVGFEALRRACGLAKPIPVLALGGVTAANVSACLKVGAQGFASIRAFL
jgi:thiamine-phosphate pyrophosphorylase